jgi:hypothetical protein
MRMKPLSLRSAASLLLASTAAVALGAFPAAAQEKVGVNSAVNTNAAGTPPGGVTRRLVVGEKVVFHERIATDAGGQTQILFLDQSSMTIGPNSDLMIDEFVYDPNAGTGKLAMSATKGVMRFVGGKVSKLENAVTLQTPSASIGIRGGVFIMDQQASGPLDVVFVFGKGVTVTGSTGASQTIYRAGYSVSVAGRGAAPTPPVPAAPGQIAGLLARMDGRAGGNGGATTVPTEASVTGSGIASTISGNVATSVQAARAYQPASPQPTPVNVSTIQQNLQINTAANQGGSPALLGTTTTVVTTTGQYTDGFVLVLTTNGVGTTAQPAFSGTLTNGQLVVSPQPPALPDSISFPLPPGTATLNNGQFSGQTFLASDASVFAAALNTSGGFGAPGGQSTFLVGGTPLVNLPTTGTGSYNGTAVGSVISGAASYTASGGFNASYNFGSQTGNMTISNFDNKSFSGPITGTSGSYSASLSGGGVTGSAGGRFFGSAASGTGGLFAVTNPTAPAPYLATGVFAGGH